MAEIVSIRAGAFAVHMFLSQIHTPVDSRARRYGEWAEAEDRQSNAAERLYLPGLWGANPHPRIDLECCPSGKGPVC